MTIQTIGKKSIVTAMFALAMIGGAVGGSLLSHNQASAQTVQTTPAPTAVTPAQSGSTDKSMSNKHLHGPFHLNENAAHEAKESPAREAQENAGQRPTVK